MAQGLDIEAMIQRFRDRAAAVRERPLPPIAGEERTKFVRQAQVDFQDYAIIGDAVGAIEDGFLVLRVDLRPADQRDPKPAEEPSNRSDAAADAGSDSGSDS